MALTEVYRSSVGKEAHEFLITKCMPNKKQKKKPNKIETQSVR